MNPDPAYVAYRLGEQLAQKTPRMFSDPATRLLARSISRTMRSRRAMVARHVERISPRPLSQRAIDVAVNRVFESYARYWLEMFRLPRELSALETRVTVNGMEHIKEAIDKGNGAILAMPHLGAWDIGGAYVARSGFKVSVVAEKVEPPELFEWFVKTRSEFGMDVIALDEDAGKKTAQALKENRVVGLLSDRDILGDGIEVDFFGHKTTMPAGPAVLAYRTKAVLLPAACFYGPADTHVGEVLPPLDTARWGTLKDDVARVTQEMAAAFAGLIARAPESWHVLQPLWLDER